MAEPGADDEGREPHDLLDESNDEPGALLARKTLEGLQIAMHDALLVRVVYRPGHHFQQFGGDVRGCGSRPAKSASVLPSINSNAI